MGVFSIMVNCFTMRSFFLFFLIFSFQFLFSQAVFVFDYDESGSQVYRGFNQNRKAIDLLGGDELFSDLHQKGAKGLDDDIYLFLKEVRIYPNPVKDILTVDWTERVSDKIHQVRVYQHNTLHWLYTSDKAAIEQKGFTLNMQGQPYGVYILTFLLSDGRIVSVNLLKI